MNYCFVDTQISEFSNKTCYIKYLLSMPNEAGIRVNTFLVRRLVGRSVCILGEIQCFIHNWKLPFVSGETRIVWSSKSRDGICNSDGRRSIFILETVSKGGSSPQKWGSSVRLVYMIRRFAASSHPNLFDTFRSSLDAARQMNQNLLPTSPEHAWKLKVVCATRPVRPTSGILLLPGPGLVNVIPITRHWLR